MRRPARAAPARRKTLEAVLAFRIDLAAIELAALVLVAHDLIGGVQLGEFILRLRVLLVAVGVMLLGEAAKRLLDLRLAGGAAHAQDLVGIAHLRASRAASCGLPNVGALLPLCNKARSPLGQARIAFAQASLQGSRRNDRAGA
jgi:hypothetical protein